MSTNDLLGDLESTTNCHSTPKCPTLDENPCGLCARIRIMDCKIFEAQAALSQLIADRNQLHSAFNGRHDPVTSVLPPEIVSIIFELVAPPVQFEAFTTRSRFRDRDTANDVNSVTGPIRLASVSRGWRGIALSTPQLWAVINVKLGHVSFKQHLPVASDCIKYSGQHPLTIRLRYAYRDARRPKYRTDYSLRCAVEEFSHSSERWGRLILDVPLRCRDILNIKSWIRLTSLDVRYFGPSRCLEVLQNCTQLEELNVADFGDYNDSEYSVGDGLITCWSLKRLSLLGDESTRGIFPSLILPSLERLSFTGFGLNTEVKQLLERSSPPLKSMNLTEVASVTFEDLALLLAAAPSLENLAINCKYLGAFLDSIAYNSNCNPFDPTTPFLPNLISLTIVGSYSSAENISWAKVAALFNTAPDNDHRTNPDPRPLRKVTLSDVRRDCYIDRDLIPMFLHLSHRGIDLQISTGDGDDLLDTSKRFHDEIDLFPSPTAVVPG